MYVLPWPTRGTALPVYGGLPHHDLSSSEEVISSQSPIQMRKRSAGASSFFVSHGTFARKWLFRFMLVREEQWQPPTCPDAKDSRITYPKLFLRP